MTSKQLEAFRKNLVSEYNIILERMIDAKGMEGLIDAGALVALNSVVTSLDKTMKED
jgi:hypothetical protein